MAFQSPSPTSRSVVAVHDTATSGAVAYNFTLPQDCQNAVAQVWLDSAWSATGSAQVFIQTSNDGGTTWYDVAMVQVGTSVATYVGKFYSHFIPLALLGGSDHGISNYVGSVAASTLSTGAAVAASINGTLSGLPMMGTLGRVYLIYSNTITTGGINVQVFAPTTDFTG